MKASRFCNNGEQAPDDIAGHSLSAPLEEGDRSLSSDGKYDTSLNSHSSWWEAVRKSFKKYASLSNLLLIKNA